ncbi:hypothetical protein JCM10450v2_004540 [Rhodotorula kratochvilovae]
MYTTAQHASVHSPHTFPSASSAFLQESPYLSTPQFSTPLHDSQFDPHDSAWFTPQLAPPSSQFGQTGFVHHGGDGGFDEEQEVLAFEGGAMQHEMEAVLHRRYSEGDQPLSGTSERHPYALLQKAQGYPRSPSHADYFDSGYTLASAQSSVPPASLLAPIQLSSGEVSPASASFPRMSRDLSQQHQQQPRSAYAYEPPQESVEELAYQHYADPRTDAGYVNVVSTTQTYSTMAYTTSAAASYLAPQQPALETAMSIAPQQVVCQPTPQRRVQHSVLEATAYPQESGPPPASNTPLSSPFVSFTSPNQPAPSSSRSRSRRPSLAHSHTQAAPEIAVHSVASGQHFSPAPVASASAPRHHSFSGASPQQAAHFQQHQQEDFQRRHSIQAGAPVAYAPYPAPSTRRRSSQSGLQQSNGTASSPARASGLPWTSTSGRHSSNGPSLSTPGRIGRRNGSGGEGCDALASASPYQPRTPSQKASFSVASAPPTSSGSSAYVQHPSASSPSFSSSARRAHPNLSISVDAAATFAHSAPPLASASTASGMGVYRSPHYSPFSPFSPYPSSTLNTPATGETGFSPSFHTPASTFEPCSPLAPAHAYGAASAPPTARERDARRRRHSADPYPTSIPGTGAFHPSARAQEALRRASCAAAPAMAMGGSSLAGYAGMGQQRGYASTQAYAGAEEAMGWSAMPPPSGAGGEWPVSAHSGAMDGAVALPPDGTVGLGLEMGVEEMHLAAAAAVAVAGGVAPSAMYGAPPREEAYDAAGVLQAQQQAAYEELLHAEAHAGVHAAERANREGDRHERVQQEIREYLKAENGMERGEKTVVIMNPKIAQRSYGTEKRLLAPPPQALLLGSSWWSTHDSNPSLSLAASAAAGKLPSPPSPTQRITLPPEIFLSISTDKIFPRASAASQWISDEGKLILERDEDEPAPLAGRALSKSLAVNVMGELNKEVSTTVKTVVTICEPGAGEVEPRVWARLLGKPMSVISKPSKKRALVSGNIAGLSHGSLVSLYNRTKTYSGSTRYLCTSGISSMFPTQEWESMTGGQPRSFAPDARDLRLVSKTNAWDAWIVYAATVTEPPTGQSTASAQPGFPPPPPNALPLDPKSQRSLYYNQTVVLQDLATGVVSPVLVLRRVDAGNVSIGGGVLDPVVPPPPADAALYPTLPGEHLGEPVSQYRTIALEVAPLPSASSGSPAPSRATDAYLGVVDEEVGLYPIGADRTYLQRATLSAPAPGSMPITPTTPGSGGFAAAQAAAAPKTEDGPSELRTASGARPRASRRASATSPTRPPATLAKSRKRGASATAVPPAVGAEVEGGPAAGVWTLPLGDGHVWSMVQVEVQRHTFFVPPSLNSRNAPLHSHSVAPNPLYHAARPRLPIGPDVPAVHAVEGPLPSSTRDGEAGMLVLKGANLTPDLTVWIGGAPCPQIHFKTPELVLVRPPLGLGPGAGLAASKRRGAKREELGAGGAAGKATRIALVRPDGVVFPTAVCY